MSKRLNNYIASFGFLDKSLIVLSVTTGSISIASFLTVIRAPVGMASASFSLPFLVFQISQEDFVTIINSQRSDVEKISLTEEGKK